MQRQNESIVNISVVIDHDFPRDKDRIDFLFDHNIIKDVVQHITKQSISLPY